MGKQVKARVPATAYLQLVKYGPEMKGTTDAQGYSAFDSKLPKSRCAYSGYFKLSAKGLSAGKYFIALQRALPKEMSGQSIGTAVPVLVTDKGDVLVVEVPGNYPMKVGKLFVAVHNKKEPEKESVHEQPAPQKPAAPESPETGDAQGTPGPEGIILRNGLWGRGLRVEPLPPPPRPLPQSLELGRKLWPGRGKLPALTINSKGWEGGVGGGQGATAPWPSPQNLS